MNAILVDKKTKEIYVGEMVDVLSKNSFEYLTQDDVELYKDQSLLDLNRLVFILECYYEIEQIHLQ